MKKLTVFLFAATLLLIAGCKCKEKSNKASGTGTATTSIIPAPGMEGHYSGNLPCDDCAGILTQVYLFEGNKYRVEKRQLGKAGDPEITAGSYTYDKNTKLLSLENGTGCFTVAEEKLIQLDKNCQVITGPQADRYNLLKQDPVAERLWKLTELYGKAIEVNPADSKFPALSFEKSQQQVSGTGGCNSFSGKYSMPGGNKLTFSPLAATKMACDKMEMEGQFFQALSETVFYIVKDDQLSFHNGSGKAVARFTTYMQK